MVNIQAAQSKVLLELQETLSQVRTQKVPGFHPLYPGIHWGYITNTMNCEIWWGNMMEYGYIVFKPCIYNYIYIYIPIAVTIEIQTTRLHCDWNQKLWRLHFMESVTLLHDIWVWKWFDVSWCIRNLWPFGWFISPLSKWDI